ncbi:alternative ribosome rescue aminoacyl-tRNA hydrolase ArfB [Gluconobacter kanchanaburiensis]|uniref:Aminoacyl-tRNA hydrolase n=1 Tax=Gluconobacter kanchanaburiensis NBRC 103587 TaxID=1307948 RepID=A0A511BAM6_9PROT|nr:alternative ribosome rescue aminoacyl-tRNA hydrolase ArfB [Gluconobacter kanchanaburiensis]MBF0861783.1 aminoacyl-tRNA hydrolase [Gluconobacter kanchanaburiensis]GBR68077.1 peptidyl-tRNA hydrolase domain protein [Gluconobacter kanchanaburiensis NBRC 103587]GEK97476.1 aminoacyl-tRNA hydrolase [Gluconobacter kanchanaburiensis NBRC 103587]
MPVQIHPGLSIGDDELKVTYILASGPGGQNVNKVATAAQLRFDVLRSPALSERTRARLIELAGSRATQQGEIVITGRRFRTQARNREDVIERLAELIRKACHRPSFRIATRPGKAARQRRLDGKSHRATTKRNRTVRLDD